MRKPAISAESSDPSHTVASSLQLSGIISSIDPEWHQALYEQFAMKLIEEWYDEFFFRALSIGQNRELDVSTIEQLLSDVLDPTSVAKLLMKGKVKDIKAYLVTCFSHYVSHHQKYQKRHVCIENQEEFLLSTGGNPTETQAIEALADTLEELAAAILSQDRFDYFDRIIFEMRIYDDRDLNDICQHLIVNEDFRKKDGGEYTPASAYQMVLRRWDRIVEAIRREVEEND